MRRNSPASPRPTTSWTEDNALPGARAARTRPPVGTTFGFTLNRPARVWFLFTYGTTGRLVGGRCVAQTNLNRGRARCLRIVRAAFSRQAPAGRTRLHFQGRLARTRKLPPGHYRLIIIATANRHCSKAALLRFTILANPHGAPRHGAVPPVVGLLGGQITIVLDSGAPTTPFALAPEPVRQ